MTGAGVTSEIVRQMRQLWLDPEVIGFYSITIGHEDFEAHQTHLEDCGQLPVMRRRNLIGVSHCSYHGVRVEIRDQREQPEIVVEPILRIR